MFQIRILAINENVHFWYSWVLKGMSIVIDVPYFIIIMRMWCEWAYGGMYRFYMSQIKVAALKSFSSAFRMVIIALLLNFPFDDRRTDVTPQKMACSGPATMENKCTNSRSLICTHSDNVECCDCAGTYQAALNYRKYNLSLAYCLCPSQPSHRFPKCPYCCCLHTESIRKWKWKLELK